MSDRLGGKGISVENRKTMDRVLVYKLGSMAEAVNHYRQASKRLPRFRKRTLDAGQVQSITQTPEQEMERILAEAEVLIAEAIECDNRLVKRASWRLAEEGIDACPAALASGEERCFLDRRRTRLADNATTDPMRVVISTDSRHVNRSNAVAFIAAAKLAQQFRLLELWWQGAWLFEEGRKEAGCGHVFLVPLIQGDMDFSRLAFVLSSEFRDHVSFRIMFDHAYPAHYGWGGGVASWSHLDDTGDFISEKGIQPDATHVARYAAKWAGMEPIWNTRISDYEAAQTWAPESNEQRWNPTDADRKRWAEQERLARLKAQQDAEARVSSV